MVGMRGVDEQGHLMRAKRAFDLQAVDDLRPGPALGGSEDDHRPARSRGVFAFSRALLDCLDLADGLFDRRRHQPVHLFRLFPLDEERRPAAPLEELLQFLVLDAREDRRIADLEAVQVQDRQNRPVRDRIEKFVGLPGGRQGARFGLAVADDAGDDQPRIVERGAEGVAQRISEFAALVDGAGRRRGDMARNAARKRELFEQPLHPGFVLADVGIDLAVAALEIGVGDQGRSAVAGTGDVEHVEIIILDDPVQMDIDEVLPRRRTPVSDHQRLHVGECQRLAQQWVCVKVDLPDREVVCGAPIGVDLRNSSSPSAFPARRNPLGTGLFGRGEVGTFIVDLSLSLVPGDPPANFATDDPGKSGNGDRLVRQRLSISISGQRSLGQTRTDEVASPEQLRRAKRAKSRRIESQALTVTDRSSRCTSRSGHE